MELKTKKNFARWKYARFTGVVPGLGAVLAVATVALLALAYAGRANAFGLMSLLVAGLAGVGFVYVVWLSLDYYDTVGALGIETDLAAAATRYVLAGDDADDVRERQESVMRLGAAGALAAAGLTYAGPMLNTDGTLMDPDTGMDINGNPFGNPLDMHAFDAAAFDVGNGLLMGTDDAYGAPMGMDNDRI